MFDLHGKVVIVTGGNGGIGLGIARGLALAGADIAVAGRNEDKTTAAVAELQALGVRALGLRTDVVDDVQVQKMVADTVSGLGGVDILVANAGMNARKSPESYSLGEWHKIGSWLYYVLVAIAIAGVGFLAQFWTEATGEASIVNSYAVTAFIVTGFVAGIVYWLFSGRYAAGPDGQQASAPDVIAPPKAASSSDESSARVATWRTAK